MSERPSRPVRVGTIGMDQRQRDTLRMIFANKCANRYHLVEESSAEICLLDLDSYGGEEQWREFRQRRPDHPLILVSLKDQPVSDHQTLFVRKPIPVQTLIDTLHQQCSQFIEGSDTDMPDSLEMPLIAEPIERIGADEPPRPQPRPRPAARKAASLMQASMEQPFVGTMPDIDPDDPEQTAKIYYNPDHYLQGHLQQALNLAVRHNRNVAIDGPWPTMELMIENRQVRVAAEERRLRSHCTLPQATLQVSLRQLNNSSTLNGNCSSYALPALFWKVALWASRGRLPEGTSLSQPIYLRRWPNFTRLEITPYALAIAAVWAEQPRSLIDTALHLQIPQRYVFAFYSAAKSLQLAGETRRAVDTLIAPPEITASKQRGLFGRLLNRIRGNSIQ